MRDHKRQSAWFRIRSGDYKGAIGRLEYGFSCMGGNKGPYFAITGEVWESKRGTLEPKGRDGLAFGMCHFLIPMSKIAGLAELESFHLFDPDRGPMHYEANSLYWLEQLEAGTPREGDRPADYFRSTVCWGSLPDDTEDPIPNLLLVGPEGRKLWLANRLPRLLERFRQLVSALGMDAELEAARGEYSNND